MSITKVARLAEVSVATVSRYINDTSYVAEGTGQRIRAAMDQLGYVPRALRPGPKRKERSGVRTGNVMLLSLHAMSPTEMYRMPAFPSLLGGVQQGIEEKGLNLVLAHCPGGRVLPPALTPAKVDGVLVFGRTDSFSSALSRVFDSLPVVWMFREHNDPERRYDHVLYDNREVGGLVARHLHELGHRRVAFASTDPKHGAYCQRRDTFLTVATSLGMAVEICEAETTLDGATQIPFIEQMLARFAASPERPTALFCAADDRMLMVYHVLQRRFVDTLGDLALIGCNNDPLFMPQMHPRPATIDIHLEQVGREAVNLLWQRLGEARSASSVEVLIKPCIVPADPLA